MLTVEDVVMAYHKGDITKDTALSMLADISKDEMEETQKFRQLSAEHRQRHKFAEAVMRELRGDVPPKVTGKGGIVDPSGPAPF
jgi:hypothetical protein